jgi:hypothetical protein
LNPAARIAANASSLGLALACPDAIENCGSTREHFVRWASMPRDRAPRKLTPLWRAVIEISFIIFLFYSNLLMGEFTSTSGRSKSFAFALKDIFTGRDFVIAIVSALFGYAVFEYLRKRL